MSNEWNPPVHVTTTAPRPDPSLSPPRLEELHQQIMNIPCQQHRALAAGSMEHAYRLGHRDARHAAAELALASSSPSRERGEVGKLTRYSPSPSTAGRPTMFVDPEGDYVRTADVEALLSALPLSVEPKQEGWQPETFSEAAERRLVELAFGFHVGIEGEYGCPGATCPGVKRLVERMRALKGVGRYDYKVPPPPAEEEPTP